MKRFASAPSENIAVAGSCGSKVLRGGDSQRTNREAIGFSTVRHLDGEYRPASVKFIGFG